MSAYMVDRNHIWFLVAAADRLGRTRGGGGFYWWSNRKKSSIQLGQDITCSEFGQMLWDENARSIMARYPDCLDEDGNPRYDKMPGAGDEAFLYQHPDALGWHKVDPVAVLKACACYGYQACEHDEWEGSEAFAAIEALKQAAINRLPGYDDAEWGAPEPNAEKCRSILSMVKK